MIPSAVVATSIRRKALDAFARELSDHCHSIVLTGSMAYGAETSVNSASDIDLVLIARDRKEFLHVIAPELNASQLHETRYFEGICLSVYREGIKFSLHVLSDKALNVIATAFVADLRVFRPIKKNGNYLLKSFLGEQYTFWIKNIPLQDCGGYRTIVPIASIFEDHFYLGIYRDKLICNPEILKDETGYCHEMIEVNWETSVSIFATEKKRLGNAAAFNKALVKYPRFSEFARQHVAGQLERWQQNLA